MTQDHGENAQDRSRDLIEAVRKDKLVGRGSCSSIDECYGDAELLELVGGAKTPEEAVRIARDREGLSDTKRKKQVVVIEDDGQNRPFLHKFDSLEEAAEHIYSTLDLLLDFLRLAGLEHRIVPSSDAEDVVVTFDDGTTVRFVFDADCSFVTAAR